MESGHLLTGGRGTDETRIEEPKTDELRTDDREIDEPETDGWRRSTRTAMRNGWGGTHRRCLK